MAQGHTIPIVDMARLFASKGVHCTIITTPGNKSLITKSLGKVQSLGEINIKTIPFPAVEAGLPEGCESLDMVFSPAMYFQFYKCSLLIRGAFEKFLTEEEKPDCLIADMFFPWSTDVAAKHGIPRLVFQGSSYFVNCAEASVRTYKPHESVSSDMEPFFLPGLPDKIVCTRSQLMMHHLDQKDTFVSQLLIDSVESELRSYGVIMNSFFELEPAYADHYQDVLGGRAWHIGPLSLCHIDAEEKAMRGREASIDEHECLRWLDSKKPDSVVYACFGSNAEFSDEQLGEIALGLEESGQQFIWVIRRKSVSKSEDYLPEGFEDRVKDRALLIRGWAPQVLILDHPSVGSFVTHCGWNSTLEGVSAGLPMVTWPGFAEQFYNEKLITDVLKIGVSVGNLKWTHLNDECVKKETIQKALREIMEGKERRNIARRFGKMAKRAVEKDGSSDTSLNDLLLELRSRRV